MKDLIHGIHRFQAGVFGAQRDLFARLARGQEPDALFIACSDSRVNPNLITQANPGDLFVLRNAGNLVPPYSAPYGGEAAAIEYAVEVLGVKDIIVCGHSHCGAMKAVLHPEKLDNLPAVRGWLSHAEATRRIVDKHYALLSGDERLEVCVEENVLVQIENLRTHPAVLVGLSQGELQLHAWVYDLESGGMTAFDGERGQFVPVSEAAQGLTERVFTERRPRQ